MQHLIEAVEHALAQHNWYAALASALTLPDICGWLEHPNKRAGERYKEWFKKYMRNYTLSSSSSMFFENSDCSYEPSLSADDFYALRCAYLHSGSDDISSQKARQLLHRFQFTEPAESGGIHCNKVVKDKEHTLQLQVDFFCKDICEGVKRWKKDAAIKDGVRERLEKELMKIYPPGVF